MEAVDSVLVFVEEEEDVEEDWVVVDWGKARGMLEISRVVERGRCGIVWRGGLGGGGG